MKAKLNLLLILFVVLILSGCAKQEEETKQTEEPKSKMSGMMVHNAWIRPSAEGTTTAFFGMIMNHTDVNDTLIGVSSNLAENTELHESYKKESDMMGMRHIDALPVDANSSVELKPLSYHVMLIILNQDLKTGDQKEITLHFKNAGEIKVTAEVKDMPMGEMDHSRH